MSNYSALLLLFLNAIELAPIYLILYFTLHFTYTSSSAFKLFIKVFIIEPAHIP